MNNGIPFFNKEIINAYRFKQLSAEELERGKCNTTIVGSSLFKHDMRHSNLCRFSYTLIKWTEYNKFTLKGLIVNRIARDQTF